MSRTDSDGSNSSRNRTIIRSESEKREHKTTLPRIEETTNVSAGPTNSRRRSRLSDPIHQFRQRDLDHNLTQLHDKKSSNEHQKLFQTEQGGSPVNKQQEGLHSRRGLLTRKPSTDDIDVHVGRHEAWGESDNSNVTSSLPNSSVSNTPPMTEKEKRKKIFRRLRSKSFDNCFEDDRSPSPPSNPLPPQPDTTLRPSSVQRTRPSKIDPPKSQGSTSRPQSSPSRRSRTPSAIQSKKTKSSALESKSADQSEESSRRPSIRNPKSLLRSGSKDDINIAYNTGQASPAYPTSADVSDVIIPSPILLRSVPQIFWRCRLNAMIHIYHHPYYNCLEIIALNLRTGEELPHIYIDLVRILEIMEEQVHKEAYAEKRSHRTQLLQTKSISCAIDYLLALLDANYQTDPATGQQSCVMNISRYNAESAVMEDLLMPKPSALRPCVLPLELKNQRALPTENQKILNIRSEAAFRNGLRRIDSAHEYNEQAANFESTAETLLAIDQEAIARRYAFRCGATTVNPNAFSLARWRWNWAIRRVIDLSRIYLNMNNLFGGIMMQALSRTKGRLSMDYRTQDIESHHNPYIGMKLIAEHKYVPRSKEIEPMAPVPHFRKLKQNEKDANYRSHTTNTDKKQIVNTMDLIQESRDRIRQKKMKAHSDKFVHTSTDASTCNS